MTTDDKPLGGPLSNAGGIGGGGRGLEGDLSGPGSGAPAGADDRYPVGMGDDDRSHSGETAGAGFATSGPTTERYDGRDDDVVNQGRTTSIDHPAEQVRDPGEATEDAGDFQTYAPSTVEVNRNRLQGVSASDLDRQREPTGGVSAEQYRREGD